METHKTNYNAIFVWLAVLTVIEIGVVYLPIAKVLIGILLIGLAVTKAAMVAMFFMHLRFEKSTLGIIAVTPMFLCVLLVFALLPDHSATDHTTKNIPAAPAEGHH